VAERPRFDVGNHEVWHWRQGETAVKLLPGRDERDPYFVATLAGKVDPVEAVIETFRRYAARPVPGAGSDG